MKSFLKIFLFILILSCNQNDSRKTTSETQSKKTDSILNNTPHKDSIHTKYNSSVNNNESVLKTIQDNTDSIQNGITKKGLIILSTKILKSLKEKNYTDLVEFVHPKLGIRFSPYAYIDTTMDQSLSRNKIVALSKSQKRIKWGLEDATDRAIKLSINDYIKEFVYDVDFLNAEKEAVNKFLGGGNSLNNLKDIYSGCDFIEFYFSGFDPKFGGMDWRALRLVFKDHRKKTYLVAIIHDQWTI